MSLAYAVASSAQQKSGAIEATRAGAPHITAQYVITNSEPLPFSVSLTESEAQASSSPQLNPRIPPETNRADPPFPCSPLFQWQGLHNGPRSERKTKAGAKTNTANKEASQVFFFFAHILPWRRATRARLWGYSALEMCVCGSPDMSTHSQWEQKIHLK